MTEIIPGIYQLQIPIPNNSLGYTNIYLVQGEDEYLLIDVGWNSEEALQSLKKQLSEIDVDVKDVSQIIVTHAHPDHYGLISRLKQFSSVEIVLHDLEMGLIESRYMNVDETIHQTEMWLRINGVPTHELPTSQSIFLRRRRSGSPALPDVTLRGGETIPAGVFNLQVLWTPGHSPGHICLYEPAQKILFSGDHVLPVITPHIGLQNQSGINPLGDFLKSLNMVKQLDVNLVLPAHEHSFTDLPTRVEEIIRHHEQRNLEILEALKTEAKTACQISAEITWMQDMGGVSWQNLTPLDKGLAVTETLSHLESMRVDGKVDKFPLDSIIYYQHT